VILPDVNVLLYAFRRDAERHDDYRSWLDTLVNGEAAYGISPQVLASVIRIGTHRRIYVHPSTMPEAVAFCDAILQPDHCSVVQPGARHWGIFTNLCRKSRATGNLVQDAWLAALAIESGCEWVTTDRDYARFPGLRWREPF
jgi:toxin-antitoxin system PIN domain toxin